MVKNDVIVLIYGCDLRFDYLLDILNIFGLVDYEFFFIILKFLLVVDGKDDKFKVL